MAKLLLVAAAAAAAMSTLAGDGRLTAAAEGSAPLLFSDDLKPPPLVSMEQPRCLTGSQMKDVCEDDPDYDDRIKRHALKLLEQDQGLSNLITDPNLRNILNDAIEPIIPHTRVGVSETPICAATETLILPKRAKNPRDEWVFVLNQEGAQQALRVEKCITDGMSCDIGRALPNNAGATCRQKYVYRRMLVVGSNKIEPEEVLMPSCCICYTTYQDLLTRTRNSTRSQSPPEAMAEPAPTATSTGSAAPATMPVTGTNPNRPLHFSRSMRGRGFSIAFPQRG